MDRHFLDANDCNERRNCSLQKHFLLAQVKMCLYVALHMTEQSLSNNDAQPHISS